MRAIIIKRWGVAVAAALLIALYFLVDPSQATWMPKCMFLSLTGWKCPGCGSQRMIHALLHGDIAAAWSHNPFFMAIIPLLIFLLWLEWKRTTMPRLYAAVYRPANIIIATTAILLWTLLRNLTNL